MLRRAFLASMMLLLAFNVSAKDFNYAEGAEYKVIPQPQSIAPHKKSVVEVFYYGCPHCYHLEESLHTWLKTKPKDVHFEQMPAVLDNPNWIFMARVFYTAKFLGIGKQFHKRYFDAIQRDKRRIFDVNALAKFAEPMGVSPDKYKSMFNSFQVSNAVSKARQKT